MSQTLHTSTLASALDDAPVTAALPPNGPSSTVPFPESLA
ncbi:hypothetical protein Pla163_30600 [Planctomycetes bacterium Pla163]|uniref:Uncharacterized protein n=1 Tax=Rohdeia mirabilis TaxID=2528008 RepID=A0A518D358_9BACT|nr:hypothetical protein Pla163_30600 [Planctomycetes bacterium Pla163]